MTDTSGNFRPKPKVYSGELAGVDTLRGNEQAGQHGDPTGRIGVEPSWLWCEVPSA
jgi:hypothetical protein